MRPRCGPLLSHASLLSQHAVAELRQAEATRKAYAEMFGGFGGEIDEVEEVAAPRYAHTPFVGPPRLAEALLCSSGSVRPVAAVCT